MRIVITNGRIIDGSGAPAFDGELVIEGDRIVRLVREGKADTAGAELVLDAKGRLVLPGLIDLHSHADVTMPAYPAMENYLVQGITTLSVGHCGMGLSPIDRWYASQCLEEPALKLLGKASRNGYDPGAPIVVPTEEMRKVTGKALGFELDWTTYGEFLDHMRREGVGCNFRGYVSFGMIRQQAMNGDCTRSASLEEIEEMKRLLRREMEGGAYGMDCGFDYLPDCYAAPDEVASVALVLRAYDGVLEAHTQHSPERYGKTWPEHRAQDGIRELLEIGKQTGVRVHISHLPNDCLGAATIDSRKSKESAREILAMIEEYKKEGVRVTWDVIPPDCMSMLYYPQFASFFAPLIIEEGGMTPFSRRLSSDPSYEAWILECVEKKQMDPIANIFPSFRRFLMDPEGERTGQIQVIRCTDKEAEGKTLAQLSEQWAISRVQVILEILKRDPKAFYHSSHVPSTSGGEEIYLESPDASVGFDSTAADFYYNMAEYDFPLDTCPPNNFNGMIKYLTQTELPFEQAVYKASGRGAEILGLKDRGRLAEGYKADVVILDPERLSPVIDWAEPRTAPLGVDYVLVNGGFAVMDGQPTHLRNGEVL
ncbi:MAG: amidohydrolase family protein [Fusicatenibacter sp.]